MLAIHSSSTLKNPVFVYSTQTLVVSTDLIGVPDLKFRFDVYIIKAGLDHLIYSVEHYPSPGGFGIFRPQDVIQSYLKNNPKPFIDAGTPDDSCMEFSIEVSEVSEIAESTGLPIGKNIKFIDSFKCINASMDYQKTFDPYFYLFRTYNFGDKLFSSPIQYNSFSENEYATISLAIQENTTPNRYDLRIYMYTTSSETPLITNIPLMNIGGNRYFNYILPVGPKNLKVLSPLIFPDNWTHYVAYITMNPPGGNPLFYNEFQTEGYTIYRKERKNNCYTPVQFMFLNDLGGFDYITFTGKKRVSHMTSKSLWSEYLPNMYTSGDRGDHTIHTTEKTKFLMSTGILNKIENEHFFNFMKSPLVYEIDSDTKKLLPVIIETKEFQELVERNRDQMFIYDVLFSYAWNNFKQQG